MSSTMRTRERRSSSESLRLDRGEFDRSLCFGAGFTVFLELNGFPAGAGEGVHQAGEGGGIAAELLIEWAG